MSSVDVYMYTNKILHHAFTFRSSTYSYPHNSTSILPFSHWLITQANQLYCYVRIVFNIDQSNRSTILTSAWLCVCRSLWLVNANPSVLLSCQCGTLILPGRVYSPILMWVAVTGWGPRRSPRGENLQTIIQVWTGIYKACVYCEPAHLHGTSWTLTYFYKYSIIMLCRELFSLVLYFCLCVTLSSARKEGKLFNFLTSYTSLPKLMV
jgi:hypothetical protein